jgi:phage gp36-like protein
MAYATTQQVIDRVGAAVAAQLTTDGGTVADNPTVDAVRAAGEGEVNSYLAERFRTPIDVSGDTDRADFLRGASLDVAAYRLHLRRPPVPEDVKKQRDATVEHLKLIAKGEAEIPGATTPESTTSNAPTAAWGSAEQNAATVRDVW